MKLLMVNDAVLEVETMKSDIPWNKYGIDVVYTAFSADEGRNIISNNHVDILLCDIEMPGEDGISLIRWICNSNYDIDCILLTCHADFTYAREAVSLNCQDYLLLPAEYEDIANTVLKVCIRRSQRIDGIRLQEYGKNWIQEQYDSITSIPSVAKKPHEIVDSCIKHILNNLSNEELSVNGIASIFYLNPIYLNRIFKKEKGISISQWIIHERMELAAKLLLNTDISALVAANKVGYTNYPYFSTVFKNYFGCTPSQYMNEHNHK